MSKNIKRLLITGATLILLIPVVVYAATFWKGSENVENIHNNLSQINVLIDDLKGDNENKDNTIKEIEKLVKEQEKTIQKQVKEIGKLKEDKNKHNDKVDELEDEIDQLEDELKQAYEDVKGIEKVTDDIVKELEKRDIK